ncbi:MAG: GNAT family N-acetyltransferase [Streptosporangiaceae bacterium]
MQFELIDPGADARGRDRCYQIVAECERLDAPELPVQSARDFAAWLTGFGDPRRLWLARDEAGEPAGCYVLTLPSRENPDMAVCMLAVRPERRREGTGTSLLRHCAREARQAGRLRLAGEAPDDSPGAAFAAASGGQPGIAFEFRRLVIDAGLHARLARLRAEAAGRAAGYTLVSWRGATPVRYLAGSAQLSAAMADAPADDGVEPQIWDASRIRNFEQTLLASGQQLCTVAARQEKTGCVAAITQIRIDSASPGWAYQGITAVLPEHRGHRLGLLVKAEMLDRLIAAAPEVRQVRARNAGANEHMVAINEQLGFRLSSVRRDWELDLAAVPAAAGHPGC